MTEKRIRKDGKSGKGGQLKLPAFVFVHNK